MYIHAIPTPPGGDYLFSALTHQFTCYSPESSSLNSAANTIQINFTRTLRNNAEKYYAALVAYTIHQKVKLAYLEG